MKMETLKQQILTAKGDVRAELVLKNARVINVFTNEIEQADVAIRQAVGLNTIATAVGEDAGTIEEVYEPFLIKEGFLKRTPRGREATELAYRHLGVTPPGKPETLLF